MADRKTELDAYTGGLFLMIIFSAAWTILATYFFNGLDFRITGLVFGLVVLYLIIWYLRFVKSSKHLPTISIETDGKKDKWFYIIFGLEGVAIFLAKNILLKIGVDYLFITVMALIVGMHFLPLAKILNRKFLLIMGYWISIIAGIGIVLISSNQFGYKTINAFVCMGCALSTTAYGLKMVNDGRSYLQKQSNGV